MAERNPGLTDREALKVMFYGFLGLASLPLQYKLLRNLGEYASENEFSYLDRATEVLKLPDNLSGVHFNAPYLWTRSPQEIAGFFAYARAVTGTEKTRESNCHTLRLYPEYEGGMIEDKLGIYNSDQLDQIEGFLDLMPEDFQAVIPIADGYWIFRSDMKVFIYESSPLCSPYLADTSSDAAIFDSQVGFFTDKNMREAYKIRIDEFIRRFGGRGNVILELINEGASPIKGDAGIQMNTGWYREMIDHARQKYNKTLLTGVIEPEKLDYRTLDTRNLVTTDHIYYPRRRNYPDSVPTLGEEIGAPNQIFDMRLPQADSYLSGLITDSLEKGVVEGRAKLGGIFLWHADFRHDDNFDFRPAYFPKTTALIGRLHPKLKEIFS